MTRDDRKQQIEHQGDVPSDQERLVGDTAASAPLTGSPRVQPSEGDARRGHSYDSPSVRAPADDDDAERAEQLGHS